MKHLNWLIAWIPLLPWFPANFRQFGGMWANAALCGELRENSGIKNSGEFSGVLYGDWCVTLPALQKTFVDLFFGIYLGILHWKMTGILVNFFFSPFATKPSTNNSGLIICIQWEFLGHFGATPAVLGEIWRWGGFGRFGASKGFCAHSHGGHLKPVTLKPVIRIFRIFRVFVSAFSAFSFCGISSDPCFPGVGGTSAFSAFFPVSGLNRWFRRSDRPALGWPALGDWEARLNPLPTSGVRVECRSICSAILCKSWSRDLKVILTRALGLLGTPSPRSSWRWNFEISVTGAVTRHGVITWEEFGEKFWWVVLHSEWSTKMSRKFRPKFRPIFRPILRPVKKICRHNFALGNVRRKVCNFSKALQSHPLGTEKKHDSQRRDRILRFFLRAEIGQFSPRFRDFLTK